MARRRTPSARCLLHVTERLGLLREENVGVDVLLSNDCRYPWWQWREGSSSVTSGPEFLAKHVTFVRERSPWAPRRSLPPSALQRHEHIPPELRELWRATLELDRTVDAVAFNSPSRQGSSLVSAEGWSHWAIQCSRITAQIASAVARDPAEVGFMPSGRIYS